MVEVPYCEEYRHRWDEFCNNHSQAWFWHRTIWIEYCINSVFDACIVNLSYLIIDEKSNEILAVVPFFLENNGDLQTFSFSKGPCPAPLINEKLAGLKKKSIEQLIFGNYMKKAGDYNAIKIAIRQSNGKISENRTDETLLIKNGYTDISNFTSVLDLSLDEQQILINMSKGHKSEIKKALKYDFTVNVYNANGLTRSKFMEFQDSYFQAAGKVTRPQQAFDILEQIVYLGNAFLLESVENDKTTGYVYIIHFKNYAYYAMSCRLHSNIEMVNPGHSLIWHAITYLKSIGIRYFELGEQYFSPNIYYPIDKKAISISLFKRGFGGDLIRQPIGEKIFSDKSIRAVYEERINSYLKSCGDLY